MENLWKEKYLIQYFKNYFKLFFISLEPKVECMFLFTFYKVF